MPKSVLIADDSSSVRRAIRSSLQQSSVFRVCGEAADGLDAVEKANKLRPDLIILDLSMPRMNGFEVARAVRVSRPATLVILFTAYSSVIRACDAEEAGVRAVFSKGEFGALVRYAENAFGSNGEKRRAARP